jgi:hypothetical protein
MKILWNAKFNSQKHVTDATQDCYIMEMKLLKAGIYHLVLCQLRWEIYNGYKRICKQFVYLWLT